MCDRSSNEVQRRATLSMWPTATTTTSNQAHAVLTPANQSYSWQLNSSEWQRSVDESLIVQTGRHQRRENTGEWATTAASDNHCEWDVTTTLASAPHHSQNTDEEIAVECSPVTTQRNAAFRPTSPVHTQLMIAHLQNYQQGKLTWHSKQRTFSTAGQRMHSVSLVIVNILTKPEIISILTIILKQFSAKLSP